MNATKKRNLVAAGVAAIAVIVGVIGLFSSTRPIVGVTSASVSYGDSTYVTLYTNDLEKDYDAFDIILRFDNSEIEIEDVTYGNVVDTTGSGVKFASSSTTYANSTGKFAVVYVDSTAGERVLNLKGKKSDILYLKVKALKPNISSEIYIDKKHFVDYEGVTETGMIRTEKGVIKVVV